MQHSYPERWRIVGDEKDLWSRWSEHTLGLGLEAQQVIALRWLGALVGGGDQLGESTRMVAEKAEAAFEASLVVAACLAEGRPDLAPVRTLAVYRRRVKANRRRLSREMRR
jgi:hypothetical protein